MLKRAALLLASLSAAGCMSVPERYAGDWAPFALPAGACPAVAGAYAELGETSAGCAAGAPCARLSFGLFAGMAGLAEEASLRATRVEIRQPSGDALEIVVRDGAREQARARLFAAKGDFRCTQRGLTLMVRSGRMVVVGGAPLLEERTFNRARDGALVMAREAIGSDQQVVVPVPPSARYWVRWRPADVSGVR